MHQRPRTAKKTRNEQPDSICGDVVGVLGVDIDRRRRSVTYTAPGRPPIRYTTDAKVRINSREAVALQLHVRNSPAPFARLCCRHLLRCSARMSAARREKHPKRSAGSASPAST